MARPTNASIAVATPSRLLEAAEAIFARDGVEAARLADIAEHAGITRASLLYHFDSKDALHAAVVERAMAALGEIVSSALSADGSFESRARAVTEGFFTYVEVHPQLARILVREAISCGDDIVTRAAPLIDAVVDFLVREGGARHADASAARERLMMIVSNAFLRVAVGDAGRLLWGAARNAREVAVRLLVEGT